MRYILILFFLSCVSTGTNLSYKAGAQKERLKSALKSNDPARIKKEAENAQKIIDELTRHQSSAVEDLRACKEDLASANKYKYSIIGVLAFLGVAGILKIFI